jgi:hypothetical protein
VFVCESAVARPVFSRAGGGRVALVELVDVDGIAAGDRSHLRADVACRVKGGWVWCRMCCRGARSRVAKGISWGPAAGGGQRDLAFRDFCWRSRRLLCPVRS